MSEARVVPTAEEDKSFEASEGGDGGFPLLTIALVLAGAALVGGLALAAVAVWLWQRARRLDGEQDSEGGGK